MTGLCFTILVGTMFGTMFGAILTFQLERSVFLREQAAKLYSPYAYFLSKQWLDTLVQLIVPLVTVLVTYWAIGFNKATGADFVTFLEVYIVQMLMGQVAIGVGLFLSAISSSEQAASAVSNVVTLPFMLFSGTFANTGTMFSWLAWLQWLSPLRYANEGFA